jgi:Fe-S-cluster containining protein
MSRRKLPILAEHSLADVLTTRIRITSEFREEIQQQDTITCTPGCSHCCYHPVHMSIFEGVLLYRHLVASGRWSPSFKAKIEEHANSTRDLSYEIWLLSLIACPLLDQKTNRCTVYSARPFACRVTLSTGDPFECHPHRVLNSGIQSKTEVTRAFHARQKADFRRHDLTMIIMPLSVALLIGERIESGQFDLEGADMAILQAYIEDT